MGEIERCCRCDDPTGRAGIADDSLYIDDEGPLCPDCFDGLMWRKNVEARPAEGEKEDR